MKKSLQTATNGAFSHKPTRRQERQRSREQFILALLKAARELQRCYRRNRAEQQRMAAVLQKVQRASAAWEELH